MNYFNLDFIMKSAKSRTKFEKDILQYEFESSGICDSLNSKCPDGLKPITTIEKFKKIIRSDQWFDGSIYSLEEHANWEYLDPDPSWDDIEQNSSYLFIPKDCTIKKNKYNFGKCDFCQKKKKIYTFENEDYDTIKNIKQRNFEFNGVWLPESSEDDIYYDSKEICRLCLYTTFQDIIITRFNYLRRRINK